MAKARSGLGRGLDSLLGGSLEGKPSGAPSTAPAPAIPVPKKQSNDSAETDKAESEEEKTAPENLYVNREDNITIKEVIERDVESTSTVSVSEEPAQQEEYDWEIDINAIEANPDQPRTNFKKEELEELSESIKKNGLLQPILVRKVGDKYQIIAGERRWQACKLLGLKTIPARVKEADDEESIILALIENIQRSNLNPIEEAYGYRRMMERGKMTQSEVAQAVSKGRTTITNALRLLELPEDAQQLLYEEKITAGHARAILSIPTKEGRRKLTDKLIEERLSVRDAERIARLISGKKEKSETDQKKKPPAPKSYKTVARALSDTLGTEVKIKNIQGQNLIQVSFKDEADLERLFRIISKNK